jgi:hypothetical protein
MMEGQDCTDAANQRPHHMMHPAEVKRVQAGADDGFLHATPPCQGIKPTIPTDY